MKRRLFCTLGPGCYRISVEKEILKRKLSDLIHHEKFAKQRNGEFPNIVKGHRSVIVRRLNGVDLRLQENKATNLKLACEKINGVVIRPGEVFSFWKLVGRPTKRKGYKEGLVISKNRLTSGIGGGLCQMANMVHWLVLNSPLTVTELHHHSDALFPDERRRVPFGTGTSVSYNYIDYRFKNNTDQSLQILVRIEDGDLCGELRSVRPYPYRYRLEEEDHHFSEEDGIFYRISKVYRLVIDRESGELLEKKLILDNHSKVMYDYSLIPEDQIRKT